MTPALPAVIDQIYAQLNTLFGKPTQLFCMEFPGRVIDETTYAFRTDSIYSIMGKPQPVIEEEFRLTDDLFDVAPIVGGPSGRKLTDAYEMALNNLVPKYLSIPQFDTDRARMRAWLLAPVQTETDGRSATVSRMQLYQILMQKYLDRRAAWEEQKTENLKQAEKAADRDQAMEDYARWLANEAPAVEAELEDLFADVVVRGYYHEIREMLGYLDVESESEELDEAKARMRASAMSSLDESETIYPVQMQPTDWFHGLSTDFKPIDLLLDPQFLRQQLFAKQQQLADLQYQYQRLSAAHTGDEQALAAQVQQAQDSYDAAQSDMVKNFTNATITLIQIYYASRDQEGKGGESGELEDFKKFETSLNGGDSASPLTEQQWQQLTQMQDKAVDAQQKLTQTSRALVQLQAQQAAATATDTRQARITLQAQIDSMQQDVDSLKQVVMAQYATRPTYTLTKEALDALTTITPDQKSNLASLLAKPYTSQSDFNAAVTAAFGEAEPTSDQLTALGNAATPQKSPSALLPSSPPPNGGWFDVVMNFKADETKEGSNLASGASQTSWSVDALFGSAGGSSNTSWSQFRSNHKASNTTFDIGFRATKVTVDRGGWFSPEVFEATANMVHLDPSMKIGLGIPKDLPRTTSFDLYNKSVILPAYPIAFLIAKDVTIQVQLSKDDVEVAKSVLDQSSSVGGGFLCFSASSSSSSSSTSQSFYSGAVGESLIIRIPGPQILGWFLEFTPEDQSADYQPMPDTYLPAQAPAPTAVPAALAATGGALMSPGIGPMATDPRSSGAGGASEISAESAYEPAGSAVAVAEAPPQLGLGPPATGAIVVLSGHGGLDRNAFNFQRPAAAASNLYSYVFDSIGIWDDRGYRLERQALDDGGVPGGWSNVSSSRIGGALVSDLNLGAPVGLNVYTPAAFNHGTVAVPNTAGGNSQLDVWFNGATVAASTRLKVAVQAGQAVVRVSQIISAFGGRGYDFLWVACRS